MEEVRAVTVLIKFPPVLGEKQRDKVMNQVNELVKRGFFHNKYSQHVL